MKKYVIMIAAALSACAFSSCDEETTLPYIPVEKPEDNTPPSGEDPETYTVTYRLDKVLLCSPDNTNGLDISGKLDYFSPLRMTLNVSPLGTTVVFENDEVPFSPFAGLIPEGGGADRLRTGLRRDTQRAAHQEFGHRAGHLRTGRIHHRVPVGQPPADLQIQIQEPLTPSDHEKNHET